MKFALAATTAVLFMAAAWAAPLDFQAVYAESQKLVEDGKFAVAIAKLEKLCAEKRVADTERGKAAALLAQAYRKNGKPESAVELLEKLSFGRCETHWLELGEAYLALKSYAKAADSAQAYGSNKDKSLKAEAAWLRARAEYGRKSYRSCYQWCDSFRNFVEAAREEAEEKGEAELQHLKYFDPLLAEAKKLKEEARGLYETEMYGRDFANYRKGRSAQMEGDWTNAIFHYRLVKSGTLKDAADCYAAQCVGARGEEEAAEKLYESFIKASPLGLYREDARLRLAELKVANGKGDSCLRDALKDIDELLEAIPQMKEMDVSNLKLEGLNKAIEDDILKSMPKEPLHKDDCGNLVRYAKRPETIDNRLTSPWHMAEIETRAWLMKGFLLGELDRELSAAESFRKAELAGGPVKTLADPVVVPSLLAGLAEGGYMIPGESAGRLRGRGARLVSYASFLFLSERRGDAWRALELAADEFGKDSSLAVSAPVKLLRAQFLLYEGAKKRKEAEALLAELCAERRLRRSALWATASFLYANSLSCNAANKAKAYALYREVASEERKGDYAPRSLMAMAVFAANVGDRKTAIDTCTELRNRYVKTPYRDAAVTLREGLERADGEMPVEPLELSTGVIKLHSRTIVIGGNSKWQPSLEGLKSSDMLLYNIKTLGRDSCSIVKSVWMNFPPDEPQVPPAKGNQLRFVRAPILFIKDMRYNFEERFPRRKDDVSPETPLALSASGRS